MYRGSERYVATFDDQFEVLFMPPRFTKDIEDETLKKNWYFSYGIKKMVTTRENRLHSTYSLIPNRNCCICHISLLWVPSEGKDPSCCAETCQIKDGGEPESFCPCIANNPAVQSKINDLDCFKQAIDAHVTSLSMV